LSSLIFNPARSESTRVNRIDPPLTSLHKTNMLFFYYVMVRLCCDTKQRNKETNGYFDSNASISCCQLYEHGKIPFHSECVSGRTFFMFGIMNLRSYISCE